MTAPVEYSVRNDAVVQAGRMMFQKYTAEGEARAKVVRITANGFALDSTVMQQAARDLDLAGLALEGAILDFSDTMRQAHQLESVQLDDLQPNDLRKFA